MICHKFLDYGVMISIEQTTGKDPRFPTIDYVLVYSAENMDLATPRKLFEEAIIRDGLEINPETIGNKVFLKLFCPFDRMALEAERIKLEMPIKGVNFCCIS